MCRAPFIVLARDVTKAAHIRAVVCKPELWGAELWGSNYGMQTAGMGCELGGVGVGCDLGGGQGSKKAIAVFSQSHVFPLMGYSYLHRW